MISENIRYYHNIINNYTWYIPLSSRIRDIRQICHTHTLFKERAVAELGWSPRGHVLLGGFLKTIKSRLFYW